MVEEEEPSRLALSNLECHFKWKPEVDSTKEKSLDYVICRAEEKLVRSPHLSVAYRCTLAYLHAVGKNDFIRASDYLKELDQSSLDGERVRPPGRYLGCEFIVRANHLKLREFELLQTSVVDETWRRKLDEIESEADSLLQSLWNDHLTTKAVVYAVQGFTLSCFGPKKYENAVECFEKALELAENNPGLVSDWHIFDWLWGCAMCLSRKFHLSQNILLSEPDDKLLSLWNRALATKSKEIEDPLFYAHYAETVRSVESETYRESCKEMTYKALRLWNDLDDSSKKVNYRVILIAIKIFKKFPHWKSAESVKTIEDAAPFLEKNADYYLQKANAMNYRDENDSAIELLESGLAKSGNPDHLWIEIQLIDRFAVKEDEHRIRRRFDSLLAKNKGFTLSQSIIYIRRSKWLFYKNIHNKSAFSIESLDECMRDIITATHIHSDLSAHIKNTPFLKIFYFTILAQKEHRPEYLAWFVSTLHFLCKEIADFGLDRNKIVNLYQSVMNKPDASHERRSFAEGNLGIFYFEEQNFKQATDIFWKLAKTGQHYRTWFARSVLAHSNPAMEQLIACVEFGNCDVISMILEHFEKEKAINTREAILNEHLCEFDEQKLFFSRYHYETCAKIELVLEKIDRFFLESGLEEDEEFVKKISDRINNFLGMTGEPWDWKRRRLVLSKLKMTMDCQETVDEATRKELAVKSWDVLHRARMALDDCISEFFQVKKSIYPHAYNKMTDNERKRLLDKAGSRQNYEMQREPYLRKRLREEWLPQKGETKLKYKVIEGLLREAFGAFKGKKVPEDVLKFVARREHHIITKEAAWHVAWVENDNLYKHNITAWHLGKVEEQLNEYRDITGLFNGEHITAYDVAHWAAEFAERTYIAFLE